MATNSPVFRWLLLRAGHQPVKLFVDGLQNGIDCIGLLFCQPVVIGSHLNTDGQGFNETQQVTTDSADNGGGKGQQNTAVNKPLQNGKGAQFCSRMGIQVSKPIQQGTPHADGRPDHTDTDW